MSLRFSSRITLVATGGEVRAECVCASSERERGGASTAPGPHLHATGAVLAGANGAAHARHRAGQGWAGFVTELLHFCVRDGKFQHQAQKCLEVEKFAIWHKLAGAISPASKIVESRFRGVTGCFGCLETSPMVSASKIRFEPTF